MSIASSDSDYPTLNAVAGFVVRPKPVAKRLDHMIGRDADVGAGWKELVSAIDEVNHVKAFAHAVVILGDGTS